MATNNQDKNIILQIAMIIFRIIGGIFKFAFYAVNTVWYFMMSALRL